MTSPRITRREALRYLSALGALGAVTLPALPGCGTEGDVDRLVGLRRDRTSAAVLGRAWLDAQMPEPSSAELVTQLCGKSGCTEFAQGTERMRQRIAERHRSDFDRGNLVSVDGWRLSQTEAVLYALVALGG